LTRVVGLLEGPAGAELLLRKGLGHDVPNISHDPLFFGRLNLYEKDKDRQQKDMEEKRREI
jgi:hypothetical protein